MFKTIKAKAILCTILSAVTLLSLSFSSKPAYAELNYIHRQAREMNEAVIALDNAATAFGTGKISVDSLQKAVSQTRMSYKKIEFYIAFYHPDYTKEHINGAPLLQMSRSGAGARVLEPQGLQVLDEIVFSDEVTEEKNKISFLTKQLRNFYGILYLGMSKEKIKEGGIPAMRLQLVRIFTLGLTGFDTPGSLNAISEAEASLSGMRTYLQENYNNKKINAVVNLFDKAIIDLHDESFNEMDRLAFLKNYIDPLYSQLGQLENSAAESLLHTMAWNPKSTSIFSEDFLNPYFFTELQRSEDTPELKDLGKDLFYDPVLSSDEKISCASCHHPDKAFTDAVPKSLSSLQDKTVLRNAPTLLNAGYADRYFYDLRAFTLEQQAEHVIFNHEEFNTAYNAILKKLKDSKEYAGKFKKVFGDRTISRERFSKALASYVLSLKSFNSPFDKYVRNEVKEYSEEAKNGFNLFMGKAGCATCHFAPTFSGLVPPFYNENESEILGVPMNPSADILTLDTDAGRLANGINSETAWIFEKSFKTTTVRNAGLTAPYFHNGAYNTLEEVIDFYNKGGGTGLGLNVINQTLPADALNLTEKEKNDLIAFIKSLNDVSSVR